MTIKVLRLLALLGVLVFVVMSKEEPVFAISYCCEDCASIEDQFWVECPEGESQSEYCDNFWFRVTHCWNFCSLSYCNPPHPTVCHLQEMYGYSYWVCH
jgi:hypothetical protein